MAHNENYLCSVTASFLLVAVTFVSGYSQSPRDLNWDTQHSQSWSYAHEISKVEKLAHQRQLFKSINYQDHLDKISEIMLSLTSSFRRQVQNNQQLNLLYRNIELESKDVFAVMAAVAANESSVSTCANDTALLLSSILRRDTWAIQFLDSFGKPGPGLTLGRLNFVGDYDLCRSAFNITADGRRINGNYCTFIASIGPANTLGLLNFQLGACLPDSCTASESTLVLKELIQTLGLNGTLSAQGIECHTDEREMTTATVVSIVFVVIIGVLIIFGTSYDILFIQWPKWRSSAPEEENFLTNGLIPQANGYAAIGGEIRVHANEATSLLNSSKRVNQGQATMGVFEKILVAFSVYTNGSKVLNTKQPAGSLGAIHGIRFLSMSWVILGHIYVFGLSLVGNLTSAFPVLLSRWTFDAVSNAFVSVDTFFTLSGLLTAYLTLAEMKKRGWKINWPLFYFHRFWRLTPPYMLTLLLVLGFQQYLGSGALWPSTQPADKANCETHWWTNLLYINNIVEPEKMCFGHSWYLSNDMQFFLLSPLMIVPFFFNVTFGVLVCVGFLLIHWITTGVLSTQNEWPTTLISLSGPESMAAGLSSWFMDYYIKPWCRIGAYVVGVLAGSLLAIHNGKIQMRWHTVLVGWIAAIATGLAVVYGLRGDIGGSDVSNVNLAAFYNAMARSAWGACVSWVIIACVSGYGGFVNTILSWSPFVALGRLTYMAYLIHPSILFTYFQSQKQLYFITDTNIIFTYCGAVVVTNLVAFVLMLALESPWIGLESTFIRKKQKV